MIVVDVEDRDQVRGHPRHALPALHMYSIRLGERLAASRMSQDV